MFTKKITLVCCLALAVEMNTPCPAKNTTSFKKDGNEYFFFRTDFKRIYIDDKVCYELIEGYSRLDTLRRDTFCGVFDNLYKSDYETGYWRVLIVKNYNKDADTIYVDKALSRSAVPPLPHDAKGNKKVYKP